MKPEDRAAIIARNRKPSAPLALPKTKSIARLNTEQLKANRAAAEADELRTEGHQRTRRPLSSAHEPI